MEKDNDEGGGKLAKITGILLFAFKGLYSLLRSLPKILLVLLAILISIAGTYLLAKQKPELLGLPGQGTVITESEVEKLVSEVSEIIALPEGETPTVATVTDIEKVKDQTFFKNAKNDDKVLIYSGAKKAFLYRPGEKRIIEVGVVTIGEQD